MYTKNNYFSLLISFMIVNLSCAQNPDADRKLMFAIQNQSPQGVIHALKKGASLNPDIDHMVDNFKRDENQRAIRAVIAKHRRTQFRIKMDQETKKTGEERKLHAKNQHRDPTAQII